MDDLWPEPKVPQSTPTPYEIFRLKKGAVYSKHRFYELVKVYHPDRHGHEGCPNISHAERMERYRLIIIAHEILSDPVKRQEYDKLGLGWGDSGFKATRAYSSSNKPYGTGAGFDASPFQNATWEDWERWYQRDTKPEDQDGNYLSPNAFAFLVILLAVVTGVAQATNAGQYSFSLEEKVRMVNQETNQFLSNRADEHTGNNLDSEKRVKWFLEKRDPAKFGLKTEEEEQYKKSFTPRLPSPTSSSSTEDSDID